MKYIWIVSLSLLLCASLAVFAAGKGRTQDPPRQQTAREEQSGKTAVLSFSSFDGGGHEYTVSIEDPEILSCTAERDYGVRGDEPEDGSPYWFVVTLRGLKAGKTRVMVYGRSPIMENEDAYYTAAVDENLRVTLSSLRTISTFCLYRSGDQNEYRLTREPEGCLISVNDGEERLVDASILDALTQVVEDCHLEQWDGIYEAEGDDPDSESFYLAIWLTDGTEINARGEGGGPENYAQAMEAIGEILARVN